MCGSLPLFAPYQAGEQVEHHKDDERDARHAADVEEQPADAAHLAPRRVEDKGRGFEEVGADVEHVDHLIGDNVVHHNIEDRGDADGNDEDDEGVQEPAEANALAVVYADEDAGIYVGFNADYKKEEIEKRLNDGTILETLNFFKVKPGDTFVINPGTIHAIGKGVRLIEIQQNSNITYRLYDYLRKDKDGNYRELHIKQALEVINYKKYVSSNSTSSVLANNQYFHVERKEVNGELTIKADEGSFVSFTFIDGEGTVDDMNYKIYDTFFLPNGKSCIVKGKGIVIISRV